MATYLDSILEVHRARAAADPRPVVEVEAAARGAAASAGARHHAFAAAIRAPGVSVIAEFKRRSPSKGPIREGAEPAVVAKEYEAGGAAAVSVLTDGPHFGGSAADLAEVRAACGLPVLRKDFTVDIRDVYDARVMGADAVLLIVAALTDRELAELADAAASVGIDALVEAHDEAELERALAAGATLVGVNQRNLADFTVDPELAARLLGSLPEGVVRVAESGITGPGDVARLAAAGCDAVLVGETLMRSADPAAAVAELVVVGAGGGR